MDILSPPGVFTPISDSWWLAEAIRRERLGPGSRALDLCTGSGVLAVTAAACDVSTTAVDVSRRAVLATRVNAWRNGLTVRVRRGRTFAPVAGERFDLLVSNPPSVPSRDADPPRRGLERAWAAGRDGRAVLEEIIDGAPDHLDPGGVVLLVQSSLIDEVLTLERLRRTGLVEAAVTERHRGPLGPLMREQQAAGNVPSGIDEEDIIICRAVMPGRAR